MNKVIKSLEEKNMKFINEYEKQLAEKYITYNTSWSMLKRSQNLLNFNKKVDGYKNISFEDIKIAGMTNYYYSHMLKPLVENFEHNLKVYMSHQFTRLDPKDRKKYEKELYTFIDKNDNAKIRKIKKDDKMLFKLHDKLMLSELIHIHDLMRTYDKNILYIDWRVKNIRNKLYHHENILTMNKNHQDKNMVYIEVIPILNHFDVLLTKKQLKNLSFDYYYNDLVQILKLLYYVDFFLSQDECCKKRKDYMYAHLEQNLNKTMKKYDTLSKVKKEEWVETNLSILKVVFEKANKK